MGVNKRLEPWRSATDLLLTRTILISANPGGGGGNFEGSNDCGYQIGGDGLGRCMQPDSPTRTKDHVSGSA